MESCPLVAIAIPNYNYGRWVGEAVQSALDQTYPNVEVVVTDNASTDDSWERLQAFRDHPRVRLCRQERTIPVGNHFGFATTMSDARYMVLFSSDDVLKPRFLEKAMAVILGHPERTIGFVATEREVIDGEGRIRPFPPFYSTSCIVPGEKQAKVFLMGNPFVPSQVVLDRDVFQPDYIHFAELRKDPRALERLRRGANEFGFVADCSMWFRLCLKGDFGYVREPLIQYREHFQGEAASHMGNLRGIFELYLMKERLVEEARQQGLSFVVEHGDAALRKVGADCLKWAVMFLERGQVATTRRLLHQAAAIDGALEDSPTYKALDYVTSHGGARAWEAYQALQPHIGACLRDFSYDPPEGSTPLES